MKRLIQMPPEVAQVFGNAAPKFVDFLADVMSDQKDEVQQMSALSFEKTLTKEISSVRLEIADVRNEMAELRAYTQSSISELRADMHQQLSGIHKQISNQTKWLLAMMLAAATIYPIVNQLLQRYL